MQDEAQIRHDIFIVLINSPLLIYDDLIVYW
jgi:hypothetical protein